MRQIEPRHVNNLFTLLSGIIVGLLLGLFIGWIVWPVEWQGATLNELFPKDKAEYLGAVADAFALNRTPEAAVMAQQRVAVLGDKLSEEMSAAIAYFSASADPNREVRINNLTFLASALGISTPGLVGLTQNPAAESAPANDTSTNTQVNTTAPAEDASASTPSWLTWLLYVLAGLLLILAGVYLILRLRQQRQNSGPIGEHIDRQIGSLQGTTTDPWAQRTQSYVAPEDDPTYGQPTRQGDEWGQPATVQQPPADEYRFEDDPEEPSHVRPGAPHNWVGANQGSHVTQLRLDDSDDELTDDDDFVEEDEVETTRPVAYGPVPGGAASPAAMRLPSETPVQPDTPLIQSRLEARPAVARMDAPLPLTQARADRPARLAGPINKHKLLETYTAQYQVGLHDYDESHPIMDPAAGKYVGECGMGTSTKNGLLQNHPDQVVALEVWLFDKTDEKNVGTQTRVLLSEYAIDHNLVQAFTKERQDDPRPFTAQPNIRFQLESQNLLLDCTITEATYAASGPTKGIFQNVTVEMSVYKKG